METCDSGNAWKALPRRDGRVAEVRFPPGEHARRKKLMKAPAIATGCEEAPLSEHGECLEFREATFMILGDTCTRSCGFCAVEDLGARRSLDTLYEPYRVAETSPALGIATR